MADDTEDLSNVGDAVAALGKKKASVLVNGGQTCGTCACSDWPLAGGGNIGNCRLKAPVHFIYLVPEQNIADPRKPRIGRQDISGWPMVGRDDWCIEGWRARESEKH